MWEGSLFFHPKEIVRERYPQKIKKSNSRPLKVRYEEGLAINYKYFSLRAGELITRFLRIKTENENEINSFIDYFFDCPILPHDERIKSFYVRRIIETEQNAIKSIINEYIKNGITGAFELIVRNYKKRNSKVKIELHKWFDSDIANANDERNILQRIGMFHQKKRKVAEFLLKHFKLGEVNKRYKKLIRLRSFKVEASKGVNFISRVRTNKQIRKEEISKIYDDNQYWKLLDKFISNDIIALIWIELIELIKKEKVPVECSVCHTFFFHRVRKNASVCFMCPPPTQRSINELDEEEQVRTRLKDKIYKNYYRKKISLEEANKILVENGLSKINVKEV